MPVAILFLALAACSTPTPVPSRTPAPTTSPTAVATLTPTATATPARTPTSTLAPTPTPAPSPAATSVPVPAWVREFGSDEWDRANGVAADSEGNVIVAGATYSSMPGQTTAGSWDTFVWKLSPAGAELWSLQTGTSGSDGGLAVAVDRSGNVILSGHTEGTLPGQTNAGYDDAWVRKLSPAGTELWARQFGSSAPDWAFGVAVDGSGNIIVAGGASESLPSQPHSGYDDAFVRKYSPEGTELWTSQFGTASSERCWGAAADRDGNVIVAGATQGALPGQTSGGNWDAFVRKYSPSGAELWTRQFGTSTPDSAFGIAADSSGNVVVAGHTFGTLPGQTSAGTADAFVRKYSPSGAELWTRQFGSVGADGAMGVAVDGSGNIIAAGHAEAALPGQTNAGFDDVFVRKFSPEGTELWTYEFGTPTPDVALAVCADLNGNVIVAGSTQGALPGHTNAGNWDVFLVRLNQP